MTNFSNVLAMPWTATNDTNACYIGFAFLCRDSANYASILALAAPSIRFNSPHPKCIV